tara:strand:- start:5736 stop:6755 length:1020 start_codon:yes stop_codon:yes gene_type:complete
MNEYEFNNLTNNNTYILGLLLINFYQKSSDDIYHFIFKNKLLNISIIELFEKIGKVTYFNNEINVYIDNKIIIDNINNLLINNLSNITHDDHYNILSKYNDNCYGYIRALFEHYGIISHLNDMYSFLSYEKYDLLNIIKKIIDIPASIDKGDNLYTLTFNDVNSIDFLGKIYTNIENNYYDEHFYNNFINSLNSHISLPKIKILKTDSCAVIPSKTRMSDAGYDLTIINIARTFSNKTKLYDTGIKIDIPNGYYVEIVPRSSISKSGYMLSNSIGIIDQGYKGNLYIALTKIDDEMPELTMPFKCCQLLIKKQIYANITEIYEELSDSNRNDGGFGSTN